jgi:hypothetical protein
MVEFALTISIFLILVISIIEMGWLFFFYNSIAVASREAARFGAVWGDTAQSTYPNYQKCADIRAAARRIAWFTHLEDSDIVITIYNKSQSTDPYPANPNLRCPIAPIGFYVKTVMPVLKLQEMVVIFV